VRADSAGARGRAAWLAAALVLSFLVFVADDLTGSEISLSLFYLVAVAVASWKVGRRGGVVVSLFSTAGWLAAYLLNHRFYSAPHVLPFNLTVEFGIYLALTLAISAIRDGIAKQAALASQLGAAYRRLDQEFELVGTIQRSLLPGSLPHIPRFRHAIHYAPSTHAGGDYYDFFELADGRLGILVADASGHGPAAAVVMAMTRALVHAAPEALLEPDRALGTANVHLTESILPGQFVTACYLVLDSRDGRVEYSLAGHNSPLIARAGTGAVEELRSDNGPPLGLFPGARFDRHGVRLDPGDTLMLYTDGLTEAADGEGRFLGEERVAELLAGHRDQPPETIRDRIVDALGRHRGPAPQSDDVTLVILQAEPQPVPRPDDQPALLSSESR
jgi:serine phosphatase RsbU (regulator of sigma subunit)